eukprot:2848524-Prymnesium_polylepis.1
MIQWSWRTRCVLGPSSSPYCIQVAGWQCGRVPPTPGVVLPPHALPHERLGVRCGRLRPVARSDAGREGIRPLLRVPQRGAAGLHGRGAS